MLNNIKLTLEYDGTNYYGWQKQKGFKTIQGEIVQELMLVFMQEDLLLILKQIVRCLLINLERH